MHARLFERGCPDELQLPGGRERTEFLEYDADRIAAAYLLEFLLRGVDWAKREKQKALYDIARALFFSLGLQFIFFAQLGPKLSDWSAKTHPHPVVRYVLASAAIVENAGRRIEGGEFIFDAAFKHSFSDLLNACDALTLPWKLVWGDSEAEVNRAAEGVIERLGAEAEVLGQLTLWNGIERWSPKWGRYA